VVLFAKPAATFAVLDLTVGSVFIKIKVFWRPFFGPECMFDF